MIDLSTSLGSAVVKGVEGGHVRVVLPTGEEARARLALAVPYRPVEGDEVLVVGQEPDAWFVIGVLRGSARTTWSIPGSLTIEAQGGVRIASGRGIVLEAESVEAVAKRVTLRAGRLELLAQRVVERARDAFRWFTGLHQVRARRARAVADETYTVRAGKASLRATGNMKIDGKQIDLG